MKDGDAVQRRIGEIIGEPAADFRPATPEERRAIDARIDEITSRERAHQQSKDAMLAEAIQRRHEEQMKKEAHMFVGLQERARVFEPDKFASSYGEAWPESAELTKTLASVLRAWGIDVRHVYSPATVVVHGGEQKIAYTVRSYETGTYEPSEYVRQKGVHEAAGKIISLLETTGHKVVFLLGLFEVKSVDQATFTPCLNYKARFFTTVSLDEKPNKEFRY